MASLDTALGVHAVRESLEACPRMVKQVLLAANAGPRAKKAASLARDLGIDVRVLSARNFARIEGGRNAQGVCARLAPFEYACAEDVERSLKEGRARLALALDLVKDPQNLGSILRTAAFFGVSGVIIPKDRAARVTPAVIRTSAGGAFKVPVARVVNLARELARLREDGVTVIGAVASGGDDPFAVQLAGPAVLVLGSEDRGLRRLVRQRCDVLVTVPSPTGFESLNVGVSAGILVHALLHGREGSGG